MGVCALVFPPFRPCLTTAPGTFWPELCEKLGLSPAFHGLVESNELSEAEGIVLGRKSLPDQICYSVAFDGDAFVFPGGFLNARSQAAEPLSPHPFLLARLQLKGDTE